MAEATAAPASSASENTTTENIDPNVLGLPEDDTAGFDEIFANYREQRLAQLKKEYMQTLIGSLFPNFPLRAAQKEMMKVNGHGEYLELKTEKEFLNVTTKIKVVSFSVLTMNTRLMMHSERYLPLLPQRFRQMQNYRQAFGGMLHLGRHHSAS